LKFAYKSLVLFGLLAKLRLHSSDLDLQFVNSRKADHIDLRDTTQAQMQAAFGNERGFKGKLWSYLGPKDGSDILIFYSGHGVAGQRDKRGYLLPVDTDPDQAEINGYPADLLYKNLGKLKARSKTVLLDACFSGDSHKGMLIRSASPVYIKAKAISVGEGITVLTATSEEQLASWDEDAQHGLFTEYFLRGVYGKANADVNGTMTVAEVKGYLDVKMTRAARRTYRREQTAMAMGDTSRILGVFPAGRAGGRFNKPNDPQQMGIAVAIGQVALDNDGIIGQPPSGMDRGDKGQRNKHLVMCATLNH